MKVTNAVDVATKSLIALTVAAQSDCRQMTAKEASAHFNKVYTALSRLQSLIDMCDNFKKGGV